MSKIEWNETQASQWALSIDGKVRGTVVWGPRVERWVASVNDGDGTRVTSFDTLKEAKVWVEGEAEPDAPARMSKIDWTPAHQALAMAEGWALFEGRQIQRDDEACTFDGDEAAETHVRTLASFGSKLHQLALAIHDAKPAEETEEDRFQAARAKWASSGKLLDLCDAIDAGYESEHSGLDDDMLPLLVDLSENTAAIQTLVDAAKAVEETCATGNANPARRALREALKGF